MQFAETELDPGESVVAEAGALMFKDASIGMDTIFGDGTKQAFLGCPTNVCLESFVFVEFFPKTGKAIPAFAGTCFWELCLGARAACSAR